MLAFQNQYQPSRDKDLLIYIGNLLKDRENVEAVVVRGIAHWGMVNKYRLCGYRPSWNIFQKGSYGLSKIYIAEVMETELARNDQKRCLLEQIPGLFWEWSLRRSGLSYQEASARTAQVMNNPRVTDEKLKELYISVRQTHGMEVTLPQMERVVFDWAASNQLLFPQDVRPK